MSECISPGSYVLLAGRRGLNRRQITAAVTFSHLEGLLKLPFWARELPGCCVGTNKVVYDKV